MNVCRTNRRAQKGDGGGDMFFNIVGGNIGNPYTLFGQSKI